MAALPLPRAPYLFHLISLAQAETLQRPGKTCQTTLPASFKPELVWTDTSTNHDLAAFKKHLKDKKNWKNVPKDRFDRRNTFLDGVK